MGDDVVVQIGDPERGMIGYTTLRVARQYERMMPHDFVCGPVVTPSGRVLLCRCWWKREFPVVEVDD